MTDIEVLERAYTQETNGKYAEKWRQQGWSQLKIGASRQDLLRLAESGFVEMVNHSGAYRSYRLTEKGRGAVLMDGHPRPPIPATRILESFELIVGFDDVKQEIARAIESQKRLHFLLSGPPACAKSLILEGVRQAVPSTGTEEGRVPGAELAFGSRTSAAGLSDLLFERHPIILLLDEIDKMRADSYSVLLGLMESGEVIETKSKKTRGVKLSTKVIAAGNDLSRLPRELKSRFSVPVAFPPYKRDEFINVCQQFLTRVNDIPSELAELIGTKVFDLNLGDIRRARDICEMMEVATEAEAERVIRFMLKYNGEKYSGDKQLAQRFSGM